METFYTVYLLTLFTGSVSSTAITVYAWRRQEIPGVKSFAWLLSAMALWTLTLGLVGISPTLEVAAFWYNAFFISVVSVPPLLLMFVLEYAGRGKWLTGPRVGLLFVVPLITQFITWFPLTHTWFLRQVNFVNVGPFLLVNSWTPGPWFAAHALYCYALVMVSLVWLVLTIIRSPRPYRGQAVLFLVGTVLPLPLNVVDTFQLTPVPLTPAGITLMGLVFAWAIFRYQLLDLMPVARDKVVDTMREAFIVLDHQDRLVDLNPAAQAILGLSSDEAIGRAAALILSPWHDLVERFRDKIEAQAEVDVERQGETRSFELRISPLLGKEGQLNGRLVLLHDVTERKCAQAAAQAALQRELSLARTIQLSLLSSTTLCIPGVDVAVISLPAREVGGDLYTCYELPPHNSAPGGYALAIGDVSGKGIPAALYMAMTTAMLSAKAPFVPDAAQLLGQMNEALYPYMSGQRMNAALCYMRLDVDGNDRYTARFANAGMIAPLLRRDRQGQYLDVGGLPLGAMSAGFPYRVLELPLQPGDVLALSSDGVVEAGNAAGDLYGLERLLTRLETAPNGSAQAIQEWILSDVRAFTGGAEQRDDMTLIVLVMSTAS